MRFGVLGTGFWAREIHAASLAEHDDAELVGVWGRDLAKAKGVGAEFDVAGFDDLDALLARVDAVSFALPPDVQVPLAIRAAEAGKHLLLEKPIALGVDDADRLVEAVQANRRRLRRLLHLPLPARDGDLAAAGGPDPAGRRSRVRGSAPSPAPRSTPRRGASEHGALWDIGPHALSLFMPSPGPGDSRAGRRRARGTPCT